VSVRGYFGLALWRSKTETNLGTAMRSAHCFGAAFVCTIGHRYFQQKSDTSKAWRHLPVYHYATDDEFFAHVPMGCEVVAVELLEKARPLPGFTHPESAIYLLGPEDGTLAPEMVSRCRSRVVIPGASKCLNVASAATIVLYDRIAKSVR